MAGLGLHYWTRVFSSCSEQGLLPGCDVWTSHCDSFSCCWAWALECDLSRVVVHGLSCPVAWGIFLDQRLSSGLLYWQTYSLPLSHQGNPVLIVVHLSSCVRFPATPWTAAHYPYPSLSHGVFSDSCPLSPWCHPTISFILCHPLFFLPSMFPSIRVFSNELTVHIRLGKSCHCLFLLSG